ncbi:MAG: zf-HC2 domain-containing protein [Acidobacteria bacterium]|nr:zf-HC2 domain-containing protein [Acidobacteriota bacterium]
MNCPLETRETAELLLDYCRRRLSPERAAMLENHMQTCTACRGFAERQRAVWEALDGWEAAPVSADFDRRLYRRIEGETSWLERLSGRLRPLLAYRGVPVAAAACLVIAAGLLMERSATPVPTAAVAQKVNVEVQPEQVEKALDAMDLISEFNDKVRPEKPQAKL